LSVSAGSFTIVGERVAPRSPSAWFDDGVFVGSKAVAAPFAIPIAANTSSGRLLR
jgi:hypothetical protein